MIHRGLPGIQLDMSYTAEISIQASRELLSPRGLVVLLFKYKTLRSRNTQSRWVFYDRIISAAEHDVWIGERAGYARPESRIAPDRITA